MSQISSQFDDMAQWSQARLEDPEILTGDAVYIDDIVKPGMLHAVMVRSPVSHANIISIDTEHASKLDGVRNILTGTDIRELGPQPVVWEHIDNQESVDTRAIAHDKVRYVGQVVAVVLADSRATGEDAAELIDVEYEPLDVVMDVADALDPGAVRLHDDWISNQYGSTRFSSGDTEKAFAGADVVVKEEFRTGRHFASPLETRGCVATWNGGGRSLEMWISAQSPNRVRESLGEIFGIPLNRVRIRTPFIGGGFGCKADFYSEEVIVAFLAKRVGVPVKWIEDRTESFMATAHAREQVSEIELAATSSGVIVAMRGCITGVLGGEIGSTGMGPTWRSANMLPGPYNIPVFDVLVRAVVTNKAPAGAYRGWGQPEGNFAMERIIERLAREVMISPNEVRRRNFWPPESFPVANGMGPIYDSGRYAECLGLAEATVDELGWVERKQELKNDGVSAGIGYSFFVESTAAGPSKGMSALGVKQGGFDVEVIKMDSSGHTTIYTGHSSMGQGIQTALARKCADVVGLSRDSIQVVFGDTETCPYTAYGTGGSRAGALGGAAVAMAGQELRGQILRVAAEMLEADEGDLELNEGIVSVIGSQTVLPVSDIAFAAYRNIGRIGTVSPTLEARAVFDPPGRAFSFGCAATFAEVDIETGQTVIRDYVLAHDCGTVIDKQIVEGQLAGGTAQGIGGALFEELIYNRDGQPLTTTFLDYIIPTAQEIPDFTLAHQVTPSPNILGGMKGVGEAGIIPAYSSVASAIDDALSDKGAFVTQTPFTPERVYRTIHNN